MMQGRARVEFSVRSSYVGLKYKGGAPMVTLKIGVHRNPRFEPLVEKTVAAPRLDLDITVTTPPELFFRNLKNDEFDVFEMSLSEYLITRERARGDRW